ncbi:hypothetical protein [Mannheimia haemolytica]|uniref:hypothetical protein n=1 Tax=Mannheimia haemolytica TaxID=75985 RepID=UPI000ACAA7B7|nr:hypothetical protein [Mannheimia haemolytica]
MDTQKLSPAEFKQATKFDSTDFGWIIMSIGMAIGAGIVFLPVQVGLMGMWVFSTFFYYRIPGDVPFSASVH